MLVPPRYFYASWQQLVKFHLIYFPFLCFYECFGLLGKETFEPGVGHRAQTGPATDLRPTTTVQIDQLDASDP